MKSQTKIIKHNELLYLRYINFSDIWRDVWTGNNDIARNSEYINDFISKEYIYLHKGIYEIRSEYFAEVKY